MTASTAPVSSGAVLELTGESSSVRSFLRDLLGGAGLIPMLAGREFRARYRSSSLGLAWSVILPVVQATVLGVIFTLLVRIKTPISYAVFILLGTTVWGYFIGAFQAGAGAIVGGSALASKLYFPRMVLSAIPACSNLPSFCLSLILVLVAMPIFGVGFHLNVLALPLAAALVLTLAVVLSSVVAMLHVYVRDVSYVVTAFAQIWFYATPVIYPLSLAKTKGFGHFAPLLEVNPMTGVVQFFRWCLFGESFGPLARPLAITGAWILVISVIAVFVYARYERVACDRL